MKNEDIYRTINEFRPSFQEYNLRKKSKNTYVFPNNVELQFIVDKWGWTPEEGAGFVVRLIDKNKVVDSLGNVHPRDTFEIRMQNLFDENMVSRADLEEFTKGEPKQVKDEVLNGYWFRFTDEQALKSMLAKVLVPILTVAGDWAKGRKVSS